MAEKDTDILERYTEPLSHRIQKEYAIGDEFYHGEVKKGLRNSDGTGVLVGVTKVGSVQGYLLQDGQRVPTPGGCIIAASSCTISLRRTARPALSASRR